MKFISRENKRFLELPVQAGYLQILIWLLLSFFGIMQLGRIQNPLQETEEAIDFRNIYIGTGLFLKGQNPYSDSLIKSEWKNIQKREKLPDNISPGLPSLALLYPPSMLVCAIPSTWISYSAAAILFRLFLYFNVLIFAYLIRLWLKQFGIASGTIPLLILLLGIKPTVNMIHVGQPSIVFINLLFFIAINYKKNAQRFPAHLATVFGMLKPTIGLAAFVFYLKEKRFVVPLLALILLVAAFWPLASGSWSAYQVQAEGQVREAYNPQNPHFPYTFEAMSNTQLDSLMALMNITGPAVFWTKLVIFFTMIFVLFLRRKRLNWNGHSILFVAICTTLVLGYHKYYDLMMILPFMLGFLFSSKNWIRILTIITMMHLLLPYNALNSIGLPESLIRVLQFGNSLFPFLFLILGLRILFTNVEENALYYGQRTPVS